MKLRIVTEPAILPVTLAEAKLHMRVDHADEDELIFGYLKAAREYCETVSRRTFINTEYDFYLNAWPDDEIELPRPPLVTVTGIFYTPAGGSEVALDSSHYLVDAVSEPGQVILETGSSWPTAPLIKVNGVRVRFVAGYGTEAAAVPERYQQAMKLVAAHFYENRETLVIAQGYNAIVVPMAADLLLGIDRGGYF